MVSMADYAKWNEKQVSVTSLFLDPKNPRIPPSDSGAVLDQRALIAELVEHDKVLELARDIADNGYAPVESLIGFVDDDDGRSYILEGNRRLAALKLLLSPDSAPEAVQAKVRSMAKEIDEKAIQKVRVLFAPTRVAAAPLIMKKHTQQEIEKWAPLMQARFYRNLADAGMTPTKMAAEYGTTPGEISEFLRTDAAYEMARRMDLPPAIKAKVNDRRDFPVSTLQRILDNTKARDALGIDFDANGGIRGKVDKDEFSRGFKRILSDIATEKVNTRTVNKKEEIENYLTQIKADLPSKKKGSFTAADFEDKRSSPPPKQKTVPPKGPSPKTRASKSVIPHGVKCTVKNKRINEIFDELRGMRLEKNPNASAVLFRILLELTISHYLDKTKKTDSLLDSAKIKEKKGNDWCPTLRQLLGAILKDPAITTIPRQARKKLNTLVSNSTSPLSVDGLDLFHHNRFALPSARELQGYWDTFEALFEVVLAEPAPPGKDAPQS
jgi:hypothetical protein